MSNTEGVGSSAVFESNISSSDDKMTNEQTAYELLLKQQQMFLQWQLENELEKVIVYFDHIVASITRYITIGLI